MKDVLLSWAAFFVMAVPALSLLLACTEPQLGKVRDVSDKREVICSFVEVWAKDRPELDEVNELCQAGADLKTIARAYGQCELQSSSTSP